MRYFISSPTGGREIDLMLQCGIKNLLLSYGVTGDKKETYYQSIKFQRTMIDSGAYSAWNSGTVIDIDKYRDFLLELPPTFLAVNLDVISKSDADSKEIELAAEQGFENYLYLSKFIKNLIPVFHIREPWRFLIRYLELAEIVGIGGSATRSILLKRALYNQVFSVAQKAIDKPRLHGFGIASIDSLLRYPFYSVDSTDYQRIRVSKRIFRYKKLHATGETIYPVLRTKVRQIVEDEQMVTRAWELRGIAYDD